MGAHDGTHITLRVPPPLAEDHTARAHDARVASSDTAEPVCDALGRPMHGPADGEFGGPAAGLASQLPFGGLTLPDGKTLNGARRDQEGLDAKSVPTTQLPSPGKQYGARWHLP